MFIANIFSAQSDLARWNLSNGNPTSYNNNLTVSKLRAVGVSLSSQGGFYYNNSNHNVFVTNGWPTVQDVTYDKNKFIEFTISPNNGYKLNLSELNISCGAYGSGTLRVDYSLNSDFSNPATLLAPTAINSSMANFPITGFPSPLATDGQVVYVRMYFYNTYQSFMILFKEGDNVGPVFRGTLTSSSTTPIATNDNVTTIINDDIDIKVLTNDDYSNQVDSVHFSQPSHGTTTLKADNSINYLPEKGYSGPDSFSYYIKNKFGTSNTATVNINVVENKTSTLIQWDNSGHVGTPYQSFINNTSMTVAGGVSLSNGSENTPIFLFGNISNATLDPSKYTQFIVDNKSTIKTIELKSFSYITRGYNNTNYEIRYSKNANFSGEVGVLASGFQAASGSYQTMKFEFNTLVKLEPEEKLYLRLYLYNNSSSYVIQYRSGDLGPKIEGLFYNKVYSTTDTIWQNSASPNWSNGFPSATKSAIIATNYSTSLYGNFESNSLTVNAGASLVVNSGGFVTVNGQIINNASDTGLIVENDANLVQKNNFQNTGNITVKKSALIPKMGYNYWSSPVSGQNLYQFSDGYNQAAPPSSPQGTPWNRFYVYNESNDYFVTTVANDITLNSSSVFQPARGYAIRGQNRFLEQVTETSPTWQFVFKGIPQNGEISSYPMKWTNADHGYNMVGNPYPSNIDFDVLAAANSDVINGVIFLWTNNDSKIKVQMGSNYTPNNYALLNRTGGISATFSGYNNKKPNGMISVGQGFIVQAKETGKNKPLVFNNSLRRADNANFYNKTEVRKDRFWLVFKSPSDINNEILLGYLPDATSGFDNDFDTELLSIGNDSFWSILDNRKLGIQAKNTPLYSEDYVKLGIKASVSGTYSISLTDKDGIFAENQEVYLHDKYQNTYTNLSSNSYSFFTNIGQYEDRFEILYKSQGTLGTADSLKKGIEIYRDTQNFIVKSPDNLDEVSVYDALGRLVYDSKVSKKEILIDKTNFAEGLYIINAKSGKNNITKKVLK